MGTHLHPFPPLSKVGGPLAVEGFKIGILRSASLTAPFNNGAKGLVRGNLKVLVRLPPSGGSWRRSRLMRGRRKAERF